MTITNITPREQVLQDNCTRMAGEIGVLCGLLRECLSVMDTIDGVDLDESDRLGDLHEKICAAIEFKG